MALSLSFGESHLAAVLHPHPRLYASTSTKEYRFPFDIDEPCISTVENPTGSDRRRSSSPTAVANGRAVHPADTSAAKSKLARALNKIKGPFSGKSSRKRRAPVIIDRKSSNASILENIGLPTLAIQEMRYISEPPTEAIQEACRRKRASTKSSSSSPRSAPDSALAALKKGATKIGEKLKRAAKKTKRALRGGENRLRKPRPFPSAHGKTTTAPINPVVVEEPLAEPATANHIIEAVVVDPFLDISYEIFTAPTSELADIADISDDEVSTGTVIHHVLDSYIPEETLSVEEASDAHPDMAEPPTPEQARRAVTTPRLTESHRRMHSYESNANDILLALRMEEEIARVTAHLPSDADDHFPTCEPATVEEVRTMAQEPVMPEEEPATTEEASATLEDEPAMLEDEPATLVQEPATPETELATPVSELGENELTAPRDKLAAPMVELALPEHELVVLDDKLVAPADEPSTTENGLIDGELATPEEEPAATEDEFFMPKEDLAATEDDFTPSDEEAAEEKIEASDDELLVLESELPTLEHEPSTTKDGLAEDEFTPSDELSAEGLAAQKGELSMSDHKFAASEVELVEEEIEVSENAEGAAAEAEVAEYEIIEEEPVEDDSAEDESVEDELAAPENERAASEDEPTGEVQEESAENEHAAPEDERAASEEEPTGDAVPFEACISAPLSPTLPTSADPTTTAHETTATLSLDPITAAIFPDYHQPEEGFGRIIVIHIPSATHYGSAAETAAPPTKLDELDIAAPLDFAQTVPVFYDTAQCCSSEWTRGARGPRYDDDPVSFAQTAAAPPFAAVGRKTRRGCRAGKRKQAMKGLLADIGAEEETREDKY